MNQVTHSINDDLLMGYATGALPQAFDLVVASHLSLNDAGRARLDGFEAIGGAMLESIEAEPVDDDALSHVMAAIDGQAPEPRPQVAARADAVFPEPLRRIVGGDLDAVTWKSAGLGVKQAVVHDDEHGTARLLAIPAGGEMPKHSHRGLELTLVLQGAYRDEDDRFARGDLEIADEDTHHTPVAEPGEVCICLIATDARLKFDGFLPRIAQRFIGI